MKTRFVILLVLCAGALASEGDKSLPRFTAGNELLRPENYHEWVFVGSSLGMSYDKGAAGYAPEFHNVYTRPEAYREFVATGKFPDKTMLALEIVTAGGNASINKQGHFEDRIVGIEVALKDESRFPEKWAYFGFIGPDGKPLARAKAFPKQACWSCHNPHGAVDNVFVQFYPVLRTARNIPGPVAGH